MPCSSMNFLLKVITSNLLNLIWVKFKVMKENNRSSKCLGKQFLKGCKSDFKCENCHKRNLTLHYRDHLSSPSPPLSAKFGSSDEKSIDTIDY